MLRKPSVKYGLGSIVDSGLKIAIGGKGGVGKTTVCAVWAQLFAEKGFDVLAIDADSNANLALAFGIAPDQGPEPLIKMKQLIAERTGTTRDAPGAYFKLNPKVSDLPQEYWLEVNAIAGQTQNGTVSNRLKLLALGAITQAGAGCACPEGAFLKAILTHSILQRQEVVLVDLAAGVEFMGRASVQGIDALVVVVEPGARSIETAINIARMAKDMGIKHVAAIANKITKTTQIEAIGSKLTDMTILANIEYSAVVQEADMRSKAVFEADTKLVEQLRNAMEQLMNIVFSKVKDQN